MERETGIEPATNSLEGCDSTTELLPPISLYPSNLRSFALARDLASRLPLRSRQPFSETSAAKTASHYDSKRHDQSRALPNQSCLPKPSQPISGADDQD